MIVLGHNNIFLTLIFRFFKGCWRSIINSSLDWHLRTTIHNTTAAIGYLCGLKFGDSIWRVNLEIQFGILSVKSMTVYFLLLYGLQPNYCGKCNTAKHSAEYKIKFYNVQWKASLITIWFCMHYHEKLYNKQYLILNIQTHVSIYQCAKLENGLSKV